MVEEYRLVELRRRGGLIQYLLVEHDRSDERERDEDLRGDLALPARRPRRRDALLLYRVRGERDRRRSGLRGSKRHPLRRLGTERLRSRREQAGFRVVVCTHGGHVV